MTANSLDNLPNRRTDEMDDEIMRRHYWACAIGLQAIDGLEASDYLREAAESHIRGERTLDETDALVRANYRNSKAGILPDATFLERFFNNLANGVGHQLDREELLCPALFDDPGLLRNVSPSLELH